MSTGQLFGRDWQLGDELDVGIKRSGILIGSYEISNAEVAAAIQIELDAGRIVFVLYESDDYIIEEDEDPGDLAVVGGRILALMDTEGYTLDPGDDYAWFGADILVVVLDGESCDVELDEVEFNLSADGSVDFCNEDDDDDEEEEDDEDD